MQIHTLKSWKIRETEWWHGLIHGSDAEVSTLSRGVGGWGLVSGGMLSGIEEGDGQHAELRVVIASRGHLGRAKHGRAGQWRGGRGFGHGETEKG